MGRSSRPKCCKRRWGYRSPRSRSFTSTRLAPRWRRARARYPERWREPRYKNLKREILITGSQRETRVAILEDDRLVELLVDHPESSRTLGNIYRGRVEAVLPGIQAAFVDIGTDKSAFLHASDLIEAEADEEEDDDGDASNGDGNGNGNGDDATAGDVAVSHGGG